MPIEASWGPSQAYLDSNPAWGATMDLMSLQQALRNEQTATWQYILQRNPNIGIRTNSGQSLSGADAVNYLSNLPHVELQPWGTGVTLEAADSLAQQNPQNPGKRQMTPEEVSQIRNALQNLLHAKT